MEGNRSEKKKLCFLFEHKGYNRKIMMNCYFVSRKRELNFLRPLFCLACVVVFGYCVPTCRLQPESRAAVLTGSQPFQDSCMRTLLIAVLFFRVKRSRSAKSAIFREEDLCVLVSAITISTITRERKLEPAIQLIEGLLADN